MSGIQKLFENIKGVAVDPQKMLAENDWIKAYVVTEGGIFAFSDVSTAQFFVGTGDKAVGTLTVV